MELKQEEVNTYSRKSKKEKEQQINELKDVIVKKLGATPDTEKSFSDNDLVNKIVDLIAKYLEKNQTPCDRADVLRFVKSELRER